MLYDFELYTNRPSYYSRPRYYSSYSPSYYSRYYTPSYYRSPSIYSSTYRPYRYNYDYRYDIPDYKYRYFSTLPSRVYTPTYYPESEKYSSTYGLNFNNIAQDIRSSTQRLLQEVRSSSVSRFARASSLEPTYSSSSDDFYDNIARSRRAVSRARMMSEEPYYRSTQFY